MQGGIGIVLRIVFHMVIPLSLAQKFPQKLDRNRDFYDAPIYSPLDTLCHLPNSKPINFASICLYVDPQFP